MYINDNFDFDQLILEYYDANKGSDSGWVHVSYRDDGLNRCQTLTAYRLPDPITGKLKTHYAFGIRHTPPRG